MEIQCGIDIIEIDRIKKAVQDRKFLEKIYTPAEIEYCESKKNAKYEHYAARFAAKEAIFKVVNQELQNKYDITWQDVEIQNDAKGKPKIHWLGKTIETIVQISISISHCKEYAVAMVTAQIQR